MEIIFEVTEDPVDGGLVDSVLTKKPSSKKFFLIRHTARPLVSFAAAAASLRSVWMTNPCSRPGTVFYLLGGFGSLVAEPPGLSLGVRFRFGQHDSVLD